MEVRNVLQNFLFFYIFFWSKHAATNLKRDGGVNQQPPNQYLGLQFLLHFWSLGFSVLCSELRSSFKEMFIMSYFVFLGIYGN